MTSLNRGFFSASIGVDRERVAVLQAALDAQPTSDSATRASLLAQLAVELVADPDWPRRLKLSDDALAMARRVGDPTTLLRALNYRYVAIWGPRTIAERVANYREAEQLAAQVEDPVLAFHAASFGAHAEMELGQLKRAEGLLQRAGELADQLAQPIILWYAAVGRAKRCIISGSAEESEKYAREAFDVGRGAGQVDAFAWFVNQLATIRLLHGTLDGGRPNLLKGAEVGPLESVRGHSGSRSVPLLVEAVHVVTLCELGHTDDARGRFDVLMGEELVGLPHDWTTLAIPAMASIACAHLGDARRAETLYAMLEPHAGQFVDNGPTWLGTTTHYMALVAATMGRLDEAQSLFAEALDTYVVLGAAPWAARATLDRERTLRPYARRGAT